MSLEHSQQFFRLDEESTAGVAGDIEDCLISMIEATAGEVQVILCSDYMKGVLTKRVLDAVFSAAPRAWHSQHRKLPRIRTLRSITAPAFSCRMCESWRNW